MKSFFENESGQALVESLVLIAVVVGFFLLALQQFFRPAYQKWTQWIQSRLQQTLFGANLHYFPLR